MCVSWGPGNKSNKELRKTGSKGGNSWNSYSSHSKLTLFHRKVGPGMAFQRCHLLRQGIRSSNTSCGLVLRYELSSGKMCNLGCAFFTWGQCLENNQCESSHHYTFSSWENENLCHQKGYLSIFHISNSMNAKRKWSRGKKEVWVGSL